MELAELFRFDDVYITRNIFNMMRWHKRVASICDPTVLTFVDVTISKRFQKYIDMFDICFHPRILLCILNRHVAGSENQVQNVESLLCICDVNNDNDNDDELQ